MAASSEASTSAGPSAVALAPPASTSGAPRATNSTTVRSESDRDDHEHSLVGLALALLDQVHDLVRGDCLWSDDQLTYESKLVPGSTIGKHIRHILDHYSLLLDTLESSSPSLNYDLRRRQVPVESSLPAAKEAIISVSQRVTDLKSKTGWLDRDLELTAKTPAALRFETTGGREMWFASHHSVHHLASLRVIAVGELDLSLPITFGVAPSTLLSRQEAEAQQRPEVFKAKM